MDKFAFRSDYRTPVHVMVLLGIATAFSVLNFAGGWWLDFFPDMSRAVPGQFMVMANNGSRQLGAAVLFVLAILSRNPHYAFASLLVRVVCEALDVVLYGVLLPGMKVQAGVAATMLVWELVGLTQIWRHGRKSRPA